MQTLASPVTLQLPTISTDAAYIPQINYRVVAILGGSEVEITSSASTFHPFTVQLIGAVRQIHFSSENSD